MDPEPFISSTSALPPPLPAVTLIEVGPGVFSPKALVRVAAARGGGPGGQNVNKVNTKIDVWVPVESLRGLSPAAKDRLRQFAGRRLTGGDELHLSASESRSQEGNRRAAFERLAALIVQAAKEPIRRRKTRPSRASKQRRLDAKRHRADVKQNRRAGE